MKVTRLFLNFAIVVLSFLPVIQIRAEISEVTVSVKGLSCPFCIYGLEKKLKRGEEVGDVQIDLRSGIAVMHLVNSTV